MKKVKKLCMSAVTVAIILIIWIFFNYQEARGADYQFLNEVSVNNFDEKFLSDSIGSTVNQNNDQINSFYGPELLKTNSDFQYSSIVSKGKFPIEGESFWNDSDNRNEVELVWTPPANANGGYRIERDTNSDFTSPKEIGTNYGKHFNILNVAPKNAADGKWFEKWMKMQNTAKTGPVDKGLFDITTISMQQFNENPEILKNPDGSYKYDSIFFGASDWNSDNYDPNNQDLTEESYKATKAFGDTGRAVTFGHDTIEGSNWGGKVPYHTYFNLFAPLLGLQISPHYKTVGSDKIKIATPGSLTENPYFLDPTLTYQISTSHSFRSHYMYNSGAIRWIKYDPENLNWGNGYEELKDSSGKAIGDNNWYLVSKNNYAQIQTGHTSGKCTPQEAQVIFNMIYYTSSLNTGTKGNDIIVKDVNAPNVPEIVSNTSSQKEVTFKIKSEDNPTNFYYRAKTDTSSGIAYSDIIKVPVMSGIRGYVYSIDDDQTGIPEIIKDPATGRVNNINLTVSEAERFVVDRNSNVGKYMHIVAVDNASNVSGVKTIDLSQYLWWKIDPATKVLTIFAHELNGAIDTSGTYTWPWHEQAADISKVVIRLGVTAKGSLKNLFADSSNATAVEGLSALNTANVTDMNSMFSKCGSLTSLDVSHFDTGNVTDMAGMFKSCQKLVELNLSSFNTARVKTMTSMFDGSDKLWKLTLGASSKLSSDAGLVVPTEGTEIVGTPIYYATSNKWREVESGTEHEPKGHLKTSAQVLNESQTRNDTRTYVWDQIGRQTLIAGSSIDFGTHRGSSNYSYLSTDQTLEVTDNRNARSGSIWRIEAKISKPLTLVGDSTKKISGDPLYHHDLTSNVITNLTSVNQTICSETAGSTYMDQFSYPCKLKFQSSPSLIPSTGQYKGKVTYTLINSIP